MIYNTFTVVNDTLLDMKLRCIVLDDSALQRITITKLVNENTHLQLVDDFSSYKDAKNCIQNDEIDLLFLDIEMTQINGFDFIDALKVKPMIVFVSVKTDYAFKAFDYDAIDFLRKPLSKERFNKAVDKALYYHKLSNESSENDQNYIFIKSNLKSIKINLSKIRWIEAFGDYVKVITEVDSHLVLSTMKSFEDKLPEDKFFRLHKSYIVNVDKIEKYSTKFVEIENYKIPLSRNKKETLIDFINTNKVLD